MRGRSDLTVFVIDDDVDMAESICALAKSVGLAAVAYSSAEMFFEHEDPQAHGCAVIDLRMDGMTGIQMIETMRAEGYELPFILLTAFAEVSVAVKAMHLNAVDVLEKPADPGLLIERIRDAIELDITRKAKRTSESHIQKLFNLLSARELQALKLLVNGLSSKQMAAAMGIAHKTVEKHRTSLMKKLQVANATELVRLTLDNRSLLKI